MVSEKLKKTLEDFEENYGINLNIDEFDPETTLRDLNDLISDCQSLVYDIEEEFDL